ncbi:isoprenoid biosynthesis glyoxalase ElbB [Enterovibrio norvegicus]|uniref:Isoprenoid biosynthesis glyoxalase ElbB n=1 Tax=Enterovibrio norvegicus TaxID=188144 RepID=A0ABV4L535_9GAMM
MKKVAVVLSGCGVFDGTEINEAVLSLLSLEEQGISYECFAPSITFTSIDHTNSSEDETRNVLKESARITRGEISSLDELSSADFDALVVVGGFGVAKNLSNFAFESDFQMLPVFEKVLFDFKEKNKWVALMCIAPVVLPFVYDKPVCTIGNDEGVSSFIKSNGGEHVICQVDDIVCDDRNLLITTPAYMLANNLMDARKGISKMMSKLAEVVT